MSNFEIQYVNEWFKPANIYCQDEFDLTLPAE